MPKLQGHSLPEANHGRVRDRHTAESAHDEVQPRVEQHRDADIGRDRRDKLAKGHSEEHHEHDDKELEARATETSSVYAST